MSLGFHTVHNQKLADMKAAMKISTFSGNKGNEDGTKGNDERVQFFKFGNCSERNLIFFDHR
jgi:hypothetical protein